MHPAPLPPIDFSDVEHGPAPVDFRAAPGEPSPARWEDLKIEGVP